MQTPKLHIRKAMLDIQNKVRPCIQVQADVGSAMKEKLETQFLTVNLFKRSSYASGWPEGVPVPNPAVAPHLANFVKNDACPEVTVKTILAGQMHQASSIWELMAFEYIAQRAFDNLVELCRTVAELGTETTYLAPGSDALAFSVDHMIEAAAAGELPVAISPGPEGLADAA